MERRRDRFRPMASFVSALSSVVANSPRVMPKFPPPPLFIPYGWFSLSTAGSQPCPPAPFRILSGLRLTQKLPFTRFWPFRFPVHRQSPGRASSFTQPPFTPLASELPRQHLQTSLRHLEVRLGRPTTESCNQITSPALFNQTTLPARFASHRRSAGTSTVL